MTDIAATAVKAFDLLTVLAGRPAGIVLPELAQALNQPRTNVMRLLRTLELFRFVSHEGHVWRTTATFHAWAASADRHEMLKNRYRPVLERIASRTRELVLLGLHEGNGIVHIDYIESDHRIRVAPSPGTRHALRYNALGKLALSRRPDLAARFRDARFQQELAEIRRTNVAWNREETVRGMVAMACPGFVNNPTEPMLTVAWPVSRFSEQKAQEALRAIRELLLAYGR